MGGVSAAWDDEDGVVAGKRSHDFGQGAHVDIVSDAAGIAGLGAYNNQDLAALDADHACYRLGWDEIGRYSVLDRRCHIGHYIHISTLARGYLGYLHLLEVATERSLGYLDVFALELFQQFLLAADALALDNVADDGYSVLLILHCLKYKPENTIFYEFIGRKDNAIPYKYKINYEKNGG